MVVQGGGQSGGGFTALDLQICFNAVTQCLNCTLCILNLNCKYFQVTYSLIVQRYLFYRNLLKYFLISRLYFQIICNKFHISLLLITFYVIKFLSISRMQILIIKKNCMKYIRYLKINYSKKKLSFQPPPPRPHTFYS